MWGGSLPEKVDILKVMASWGARAISTGGYIDLLPDRQSWWQKTPDGKLELRGGAELTQESKLLLEWVNSKGLPQLRTWWEKERYDSGAKTTINDGPYHFFAATNNSGGYLYIRAWIEEQTAGENPHG